MVMLDRLRIRNVFVRNGVTTEESAEEIAEVLDESFRDAAADFVTTDQHATSEERFTAALAGMDRRFAEHLAQLAEREVRRARDQAERDTRMAREQAERDRHLRNEMLIIGGLVIATLGICTAILIAVLL